MLIVKDRFTGISEPEVKTYIDAVEAADGELIEFGVANAVNDFVRGCKNDNIWESIKASCILAGARTLQGALVPLVGVAPTNNNFVSPDYNRKTGLKGGSTKYLNSNRNNNADPQNSNHNVLFVSNLTSSIGNLIGTSDASGTNVIETSTANAFGTRCRNGNISNMSPPPTSGFMGFNRNNSSSYSVRYSNSNKTVQRSSQSPQSSQIWIFQRNGDTTRYSNHRFSFYSIGESLDLTKLDTRVTKLMREIEFGVNTGLSASGYDIDTINYINAAYNAGASLG